MFANNQQILIAKMHKNIIPSENISHGKCEICLFFNIPNFTADYRGRALTGCGGRFATGAAPLKRES